MGSAEMGLMGFRETRAMEEVAGLGQVGEGGSRNKLQWVFFLFVWSPQWAAISSIDLNGPYLPIKFEAHHNILA